MALSSGLTIDPNSNAARQDRITWIHGNEPLCNGVGHLLSTLDKLITKVKQGLTEYHIEGRTMVSRISIRACHNILCFMNK